MKKLICLTLMLVFVSFGSAQKTRNKTELESLVSTERAFAKTSEDKETRPSFMEFIADEESFFARPRSRANSG